MKDLKKNILGICNQYKIKAIEAKDYDTKNEMWNKTIEGFFELFKRYKLTKNSLKNIVEKSNMKVREGFLKFIEFLYKEKIPLIIISAGVANCIEIFLENNHILYDNIIVISNLIKFDLQGNILELPQFVINPANKNKISFSNDIQEKLKNREKVLLFGDTPSDIRMIENMDKEKTYSIAFSNRKEDIEDLRDNFDAVSEDSKILELLEKIIINNSQN